MALLFFLLAFDVFSQEKREGFSLDFLSPFLVDTSLEKAVDTHGPGQKMRALTDSLERTRFSVASPGGHTLTLWAQSRGDRIMEFYATFPTQMSGSVVHRALLSRYGKQEKFFKKNEQAIYLWNNADGKKITYSIQCSLTCFPLYLAVWANPPPADLPSFKTTLDSLIEGE